VGLRSQPAGYPAMTPYGHRGVALFLLAMARYPQHGHRGVSAFSFRDGAIPPTRASRRKRSFFSRRRDTPTSSRCKEKRRIAGSHWLPRDDPRANRGASAPSLRGVNFQVGMFYCFLELQGYFFFYSVASVPFV